MAFGRKKNMSPLLKVKHFILNSNCMGSAGAPHLPFFTHSQGFTKLWPTTGRSKRSFIAKGQGLAFISSTTLMVEDIKKKS